MFSKFKKELQMKETLATICHVFNKESVTTIVPNSLHRKHTHYSFFDITVAPAIIDKIRSVIKSGRENILMKTHDILIKFTYLLLINLNAFNKNSKCFYIHNAKKKQT